jgi:hypothetical protein
MFVFRIVPSRAYSVARLEDFQMAVLVCWLWIMVPTNRTPLASTRALRKMSQYHRT